MRNLAIASVVLGIAAIALSFCPLIPLQIVGAIAGVVGIVFSRRARRADYRDDFPCTVGLLCSIAGVFLCLLVPVLSLVANLIVLIRG